MTTTPDTIDRSAPSPSPSTQADIDDLRRRLDRTRFAPAAPGDSWDYGTPTSYLRDMVERWKQFDWREVEARINAHPNYLTEIDGQTIHFVHVRSAVPGAPCAAPGPHLPRLVPRVPAAHRPADRRRLRPRHPLDARLRVLHPGRRRRLDDGARRPRLRRADARPGLRVVRRARLRRRRDWSAASWRSSTPRASSARTSCSCSPSRRATRPSSRASARRSTPRWSTCSGSSPSAATTR